MSAAFPGWGCGRGAGRRTGEVAGAAAGGGNTTELFEVAPGVLSELSRLPTVWSERLEGLRICPEKLPELLLCRSTAPVGIGISRPCVAAVLWAASAGCNRARAKAGEALGGFYPPRGKPTRRETHPGTAGAGPWSSRRHRSAARAPPCWGGNAKFLQQRTLNNSFQEEPWVFLRRYHPRRAGRRVT